MAFSSEAGGLKGLLTWHYSGACDHHPVVSPLGLGREDGWKGMALPDAPCLSPPHRWWSCQ